MKDWEINRHGAEPYLRHIPCWYVAGRHENKWYCLRCKKEVPEEIAFCAELAGCTLFKYLMKQYLSEDI